MTETTPEPINNPVMLAMATGKLHSITCYSDLIDTREVHARMDELESDNETPDGEQTDVGTWFDPIDQAEYALLAKLIVDVTDGLNKGDDGTQDGITLVRESFYVEYVAQYYAETWNCEWKEYNPRTYKEHDLTWEDITSRLPFKHIDWDAVADEVRPDFKEIEYCGITYLFM